MARKTTSHCASAVPTRRKWLAKSIRPRCVQLEDRLAPALFNVQPSFAPGQLNNNGCIAAADFNKDGLMDAVLSNYGSSASSGDGNTITVLTGKPGGGFTRQSLATKGTNVSFVSVADINSDGWLDVVASNANMQNTGTVSVFQNHNGSLSMDGRTPFSTFGNNASWVGLADVTGDNVLDVIVGNFGKEDGENFAGNKVTIFQGNVDGQGHGDFTYSVNPITTLSPELQFVPIALAVADYDGDGLQDIVAVSPGVPPDFGEPYPNGTVYSFRGTGSGSFAQPNLFDTGGVFPVNVQAADLNGDSKPDLIVANAGDPNQEFSDNSVGLLINNSSTNNVSFNAQPSLTANCYGTFAVAAADFDLNGKMDIASINYGSVSNLEPNAFVSVYMGNGSGSFSSGNPGTYDTLTNLPGGQYLAVGDYDSNGSPDLIVAHATFRVGLLFNTSVSAPAVTINQGSGQADPTHATSIVFDVVFSQGVTGFIDSDVNLTGSSGGGAGLLAAVTQNSPTSYTLTATAMTATSFVKATTPAGAATAISNGASSQASTSTDNQVTYDLVVPTVTIDQAAGQADPAMTGPILFTAIFSENVTGFSAADVDLSASSLTGLSATVTQNSPTNYTVSVTGMAGSGTVVAKVVAGAATDAAGNTSAASTSTDNTVTFGTSAAPTLTINQAAGQLAPTNSSP